MKAKFEMAGVSYHATDKGVVAVDNSFKSVYGGYEDRRTLIYATMDEVKKHLVHGEVVNSPHFRMKILKYGRAW